LDIDVFVDTDFSGLWPHEDPLDPTCVKSCTGYVIKLSSSGTLWGSRLHSAIAFLMMEAEYTALSITMREVLPFKALVEAVATVVSFAALDVTTFCTAVWEDNVGALTLAILEPGRRTPRSKHYAIKLHWFHSKLKPNNMVVEQISTHEQQADIMTKGLCKDLFVRLRLKLSGW
jgi:hypothetical protein